MFPFDATASLMKTKESLELDDVERYDAALQEAEDVLEAIGGDIYLNGFNLLGVIATPMGSSYASSSLRYSSSSNPSAVSSSTAVQSSAASNDVLTDTYLSLGTTLTQVSEQMEFVNHMLEDWSRQFLEPDDDMNASSEDLPSSQLRVLPAEMADLDLQALQDHLEKSGLAAHSFRETSQVAAEGQSERTRSSSNGRVNDAAVSARVEEETPAVFYQEDMDLSDPNTFQQLLLQPKAATIDESQPLDEHSVSMWFPLLPPDTFGNLLDRVELALLMQVRIKSGDFFAESLRFAQLQEWIDELLRKVTDLQTLSSKHLHEGLLDPMDSVPIADQQRIDLRALASTLERTSDLMNCRKSLVSVLAAQDDLAAINKIGDGRDMLTGTSHQGCQDHAPELGRLKALEGVSQQLNQYEQLVVSRLRDELVELFLEWNSPSSNIAMNGSTMSSKHQQKDRVREIVASLKRCLGMERTLTVYHERLDDMILMTVRTTVGEFAAELDVKSSSGAVASFSTSAASMTFPKFLDCINLLFEQLFEMLKSASAVAEFCKKEGLDFYDHNGGLDKERSLDNSSLDSVVSNASEVCAKQISELLRFRRESHSLLSLAEMKSLWDTCSQFVGVLEGMMSSNASSLRSTLQAQAKSFVDRSHESNMAALVAALDAERWSQCEVSEERQEGLTRLCSGRSAVSTAPKSKISGTKQQEAEVEGKHYKVVWSCLLLLEMINSNIASATHFGSLSSSVVGKVAELLRLFNSRSTHLVLGTGAMQSSAKLKSINAKHLSLVTQCLGLIIAVLPHIRASLMTQLPPKQHTLLNCFDQIRRDFAEHNEKVLNQLVNIIGVIVEEKLLPKLSGTDFDSNGAQHPCVFLDGIATNTKKMHQVLRTALSPDHLRDVFSRIFMHLDTKLPEFLTVAAQREDIHFSLPQTDSGKHTLLREIDSLFISINGLDGVVPWDFTALSVLRRRLEIDESETVCKGEDPQAETEVQPEAE